MDAAKTVTGSVSALAAGCFCRPERKWLLVKKTRRDVEQVRPELDVDLVAKEYACSRQGSCRDAQLVLQAKKVKSFELLRVRELAIGDQLDHYALQSLGSLIELGIHGLQQVASARSNALGRWRWRWRSGGPYRHQRRFCTKEQRRDEWR